MKRMSLMIVVFVTAGFAQTALADNLLTNGSFQTGDLTGWESIPTDGGPAFVSSGFAGYTGEDSDGYFCVFGGEYGAWITQGFSDIPGHWYNFGIWFNNSYALDGMPGEGITYFDGFWYNPFGGWDKFDDVFSLTYVSTEGVWTYYTARVLGSGYNEVEFVGYGIDIWTNPSTSLYIALDNVSVTLAPTPECGSLLLLAGGLLCIGTVILRKPL